MPRQREDAGVVLAAEEDRLPSGHEPPVDDLKTRHFRDRKPLGEGLHRPELDSADDAVPVRLGVVGIEVGTLDHLLRHAPAVVHAKGDRMHARTQLAQVVKLRRGHVVAGIHQGAVQVQFRRLGALQIQRQVLLPPHIRRDDLLPVPGLAHEGMPARQPAGFHGLAILRLHGRKPLPREVRRPGQDDGIGKQRIGPLPQERIDRHHPRRIQVQPPLPGDLHLRRTGHGGQHGHCDRKTTFHIAKIMFFSGGEKHYFKEKRVTPEPPKKWGPSTD